MTDFPNLLYTSTCEIPTLLYTWSLKRYPFRAEPPRIGHYREYPRGFWWAESFWNSISWLFHVMLLILLSKFNQLVNELFLHVQPLCKRHSWLREIVNFWNSIPRYQETMSTSFFCRHIKFTSKPSSPKTVIIIKFLFVLSVLCKAQWSWELWTWSHKMNLLDILSTSPHYLCRKWLEVPNENSNFWT